MDLDKVGIVEPRPATAERFLWPKGSRRSSHRRRAGGIGRRNGPLSRLPEGYPSFGSFPWPVPTPGKVTLMPLRHRTARSRSNSKPS